MKKRKLRERSSRLAPIFKSVLIGLVSYLVLLVVLLLGVTPEQHDIRVGVPAPMDILASKDVKDTVTTEQNREAAAAKVDFSYKSAEGDVTAQVIEELREHFSELEQILEGLTVERVLSMSDADFDYMNGSISMALTREQYAALLDTDAGLIRQLGEDTEKMVREQMNNTILEGQAAAVRQAEHAHRRGGHRGKPPEGTGSGGGCGARQGRGHRAAGRDRHRSPV